MPASANGLPCSDVKRGTSSSVEASSTSAIWSKVARRAASSRFQSRAAWAAARKATSSLRSAALGGSGEDLACGRILHAERRFRLNDFAPDGHHKVRHGDLLDRHNLRRGRGEPRG